jgi:hypothetical protein
MSRLPAASSGAEQAPLSCGIRRELMANLRGKTTSTKTTTLRATLLSLGSMRELPVGELF